MISRLKFCSSLLRLVGKDSVHGGWGVGGGLEKGCVCNFFVSNSQMMAQDQITCFSCCQEKIYL